MRLSTYLDLKYDYKIEPKYIKPFIKIIFNKYYNFKFNKDIPFI